MKHKPFWKSVIRGTFVTFFLVVLFSSLFSSLSCSSTPKNQEPAREISKAASEYAVFGNKFYREGRYREAEEMYLYSLQYYKRVDNRVGILNAYNSLGKTYLAVNRMQDADRVFGLAVGLVKGIEREGGGAEEELIPLKAETLNNLGEAALRRGDIPEALELFNSGIEILPPKNHHRETAIILHNRGNVYLRMGEHEKAREDFSRSLELNTGRKADTEIASNYYMLALLASHENQAELAKTYGLKALELDKKTENSAGIAQDLILLGRIAAKEKDRIGSADYYMRAYHIYNSLNLDREIEKVVEYLHEIGASSRISEEDLGIEIEIEGPELESREYNIYASEQR